METNITATLEAIEFQRNGELKASIESCVKAMRLTHAPVERAQIAKTMARVILDKTGILLSVVFVPGRFNMKIFVPTLVASHPLMSRMEKKMLADPTKDYRPVEFSRDIGGTVDLRTSKIGGDFSLIESTLYLPVAIFEDELLTDGEWAATILHEIGHVYGYFELLGHTFITNMVLNEVVSRWADNVTTERRIDILQGIEKQFKTTIANKPDLAEGKDPSVVIAIVNSSSMNNIRSELGTPYYDARTSEFLADQFAVRHGGGRDLVTGLDKINRSMGWLSRGYEFRSTNSMIVSNLIQLTMLLTLNTPFDLAIRGMKNWTTTIATKAGIQAGDMLIRPVINLGVMGARRLGIEIGVGVSLSYLFQLMKDKGGSKYDDAPARFQATKREMIGDLKTPGLDKEYIRRVLADLAVIEQVVNGLNKVGPLDSMLYNYIIGSFKGDRKEIKLQQEYETLANNPLFKHAAQLSTMESES